MDVLSFSKAVSLRRQGLTGSIVPTEARIKYIEAVKNKQIPAEEFWYTNRFVYDIWINQQNNEAIKMSKYSYAEVFGAFDALLRKIDHAKINSKLE